jgi:hypothetical protein
MEVPIIVAFSPGDVVEPAMSGAIVENSPFCPFSNRPDLVSNGAS